jgi:hypothetical protein
MARLRAEIDVFMSVQIQGVMTMAPPPHWPERKKFFIRPGGAIAIGDATSPLIMQNALVPCELVRREHGTVCCKGVAEHQDASISHARQRRNGPTRTSV